MVKENNLVIRIEEGLKDRLKQASSKKGMSMSTFVVNAVEQAIESEKNMKPNLKEDKHFKGVPTFFKACCFEAQSGGGFGYDRAAYELCRHTPGLTEYDDTDELHAKLDELADILRKRAPDEEAIVLWFEREFPNCMLLVPKRRRSSFVQGVLKAYEDMAFCVEY